METFVIQKITHEDVDAVIAFQIGLAKETQNMDLQLEIIQKGVRYLVDNPKGVFSLVAKINGQAVGDIMADGQNEQRAWITSVYISSQHRKKGIFRKLFDKYCDLQRQKGLKWIYLYLKKSNDKALKTYMSLGMTLSQDIDMFGYEFIYTNDVMPEVTEQFRIESQQLNIEHDFIDILQIPCRKNTPLCIYSGDVLIGYAQYFQEYTQWRFGRMINITTLLLNKSYEKSAIAYLLKYIKDSTEGLRICNIRFLASKSSPLKEIIEIPQLQYDVMQMTL